MTSIKGQSTAKNLVTLITDAIQEKKGKHITVMDLHGLDGTVTDYFVICEGSSSPHIDSIKDFIEKDVREKAGEKPWHVEGTTNKEWVLLDYVNVVVHVFTNEKRNFYNLEGLWADAAITELQHDN